MLSLRPTRSLSLSKGAAPTRSAGRFDYPGAGLAVLTLAGMSLVMLAPTRLVQDVEIGRAYLPVTGDSRWLTPLALTTFAIVALFVLRQVFAHRPLVGWRTWPALARETDVGARCC
ncbi:hypothetical protein [Aeromicrobium sp. UC242_57]|uniref:hypothetical protein n=1 Tax=Aeromicrobium sp. UC242_57 TaxID=3374624 RepID=UPI00379DD32D